jgi:hypothetical protein
MKWRQLSRLAPGWDLTARIRRMLVVKISMPIFWSSPWDPLVAPAVVLP